MDYDKERRQEMLDAMRADRELQKLGFPFSAIVTVAVFALAVLFAVGFILLIGFSVGNYQVLTQTFYLGLALSEARTER